jgi:hypothetical protein
MSAVRILPHYTYSDYCRIDRITKFSIYEKFGIKYYLIVDAEKETVEIYVLKDSKYELQSFSAENNFTFSLSVDGNIDIVVKNFRE